MIDVVLAPLLAPTMIRLAQGAARICSVLVSRARGGLSRAVLAGPTAELAERGAAVVVRQSAEQAAATAAAKQSFNPVAGITRAHHVAFVAAADEAGLVIVVRHTNPKSISLIERGCPDKPKNLEFINTSPQDMYKGFRKGATAYLPRGGGVRHFETEDGVRAFYESLGRQTRVGQYPRPGPKVPVVDELARRRAMKG